MKNDKKFLNHSLMSTYLFCNAKDESKCFKSEVEDITNLIHRLIKKVIKFLEHEQSYIVLQHINAVHQ